METINSLVSTLKSKYMKLCLLLSAWFGLTSTAFAAAPDATNTNANMADTTNWLIAVIQGNVGYTVALVIFAFAIFLWFQKRDLMITFSALGVAMMVAVFPDVLESFFTVSLTN